MIRIICQRITKEEVPSNGEQLATEPTTPIETSEEIYRSEIDKLNCKSISEVCEILLNQPVFIMLAQDKLSLATIKDYEIRAKKIKFSVKDVLTKFSNWRQSNKVKNPD